MQIDLEHYKDEARHNAAQLGKQTLGSGLGAMLRWATGGGATAVTLAVRAGKATGLTYVFGLIGMTASTLVRVYLNDQEHQREKDRLRDMYRPEVAALLHKDPAGITTEDFLAVAARNPSLQEALDRSSNLRTFKNAMAIFATVASFAAVFFLLPATMVAMGGLGASIFGIAVGMGAYEAGKWLFGKVGSAVLDIFQPTAVHAVGRMEKAVLLGKHIATEQAMEIYTLASPPLAQKVEEEMGKPYAKLSPTEKTEAIIRTGMLEEMETVTLAINENRMNPRELTFRVHGQESGVSADPNLRVKLNETLSTLKEKIHVGRQAALERFSSFKENLQNQVQGFSQHFGRSNSEALSFVQQENARGNSGKGLGQGWSDYVARGGMPGLAPSLEK